MKNVLIIADNKDIEHFNPKLECKHWNIFWHVTNFQRLNNDVPLLKDIINNNKIDFILFSRNEQISGVKIAHITKLLNIGYSSLSGIDKKNHKVQMKCCFKDFISAPSNFEIKCLKIEPNLPEKGNTYSIIFDMEQLGGVRHGLPRILDILDTYKVRATFFTTNLINKIYPSVLKRLIYCGHEIGLHGLYHENLALYSSSEQENLIRAMMDNLKPHEIKGVNFIGRMNKMTLEAISKLGIKYFIYPLKNTIRFLSIPPRIRLMKEKIWMVPLNVETYNKSWKDIRKQIDNSLNRDVHMTILMHPFFDGSMKRLNIVTKILEYLRKKKIQPVRLDHIVKTQKMFSPEDIIPFKFSQNRYGTLGYVITRMIQNRALRKYDRANKRAVLKAV